MTAVLPEPGAGDAFYIVDISGWIHRCMHAIKPEAFGGERCEVTKGVTRMLVKLLRVRFPALLAVAVDPPGRGWRHEFYPGYKAHREPLHEDVRLQVARILQIVRLHHIPVLEAPGFEADDCIATAARWAESVGMCVVVVARDKDLWQLCSGRTVIWDGDKTVVGPGEVRGKWGVGPELLGDLLALAGDITDGVPGVQGIGPKIAAELLNRRGSLDEVLAKPDFAKTERIRRALRECAGDARISRELVGLATAPIALDPAELRLGGYEVERLRAAYLELGLVQLASEVEPLAKRWRSGAPAALVTATRGTP